MKNIKLFFLIAIISLLSFNAIIKEGSETYTLLSDYNFVSDSSDKNTKSRITGQIQSISDESYNKILYKLQKQGYSSDFYAFNVICGDSTASNNIKVTINYLQNKYANKILKAYSYNESTNTFKCLGNIESNSNSVSFNTDAPGIHFIALNNAPVYDHDNKTVVYNENFNYTGLPDSNKWSYDTGNWGFGNDELQYYTAYDLDNANVSNGNLNITALREDYQGSKYTSARLVSKNSYLYGKFEIRAKLPSGAGTWPAIWLLPTNNEYGEWPNSGEIDIMEHIGKDPGIIHGSLHTALNNFKAGTEITSSTPVNDCTSTYHTYGLEWTPEYINISVDDNVYFKLNRNSYNYKDSYKTWPFDKEFHLILNLAIGGNWGGYVDDSIFPQTMSIDYIKIYDLGLDKYSLNKTTTPYEIESEIFESKFNDLSGFSSFIQNDAAKCDIYSRWGLGVFDIARSGNDDWDIQLIKDNLTLEEGKTYKYSFKIKSTLYRKLSFGFQQNRGDYGRYHTESVSIGNEFTTISGVYTHTSKTDTNASFVFYLGGYSLPWHQIQVDDFKLTKVNY